MSNSVGLRRVARVALVPGTAPSGKAVRCFGFCLFLGHVSTYKLRLITCSMYYCTMMLCECFVFEQAKKLQKQRQGFRGKKFHLEGSLKVFISVFVLKCFETGPCKDWVSDHFLARLRAPELVRHEDICWKPKLFRFSARSTFHFPKKMGFCFGWICWGIPTIVCTSRWIRCSLRRKQSF